MKLSQIIETCANVKPESFWLWHPVVVSALPYVKDHGLVDPFLFGTRKAALSVRVDVPRVILRVSKAVLDQDLEQDLTIKNAKESCREGCWHDSQFRRWLNSMPLHPEDALTYWAQGGTFSYIEHMKLATRLLDRLERHGFWKYKGHVDPRHLSVMCPDKKVFVSLAGLDVGAPSLLKETERA